MRALALMMLLVASACGPAPGYTPDGQFTGDPNAGLASPRRPQPAPAQTSGGQAQSPQGPQQGDPAFYDNLSSASGQPAQPPQPAPAACDDSCRFARNGECDDGRQGSDTDVCAAGTDCTDCGS